MRDKYGTWFDFVQAMGDLTQGEHEALQAHAEWFTDLHKIKMKTPYAMVALETLDLADGLHAGMDVAELTQRCLDRLRGDVILKHDLHEHDFASRWREVPLRTLHTAKGLSRQWFALDGDRFVSRLNVSETLRSDFDAMTTELVAVSYTHLRAHET